VRKGIFVRLTILTERLLPMFGYIGSLRAKEQDGCEGAEEEDEQENQSVSFLRRQIAQSLHAQNTSLARFGNIFIIQPALCFCLVEKPTACLSQQRGGHRLSQRFGALKGCSNSFH